MPNIRSIFKSLRTNKKAKTIEAPKSKSEDDLKALVKPQRTERKLSPQELEDDFIASMSNAMQELPMLKEVHVGVFTGCKVLNQAGKCPAEVNMVVAINRGSQYIEAPEVTSTTLVTSTPASQQALVAYEEKAADVALSTVEEPEFTTHKVSRILSIGDFQI